MTKPLTFVLPLPPNLANGRMHHMVKHKIRRGYYAACDYLVIGLLDNEAIEDIGWLTKYGAPGTSPLRKECQRIVDATFNAKGWPKVTPPTFPFACASLSSRMTLGGLMDTGNAMNRHKWAEDWLATRGYVASDTPDVLRWSGFPEQVVTRSEPYRLHLTLTPLEG